VAFGAWGLLVGQNNVGLSILIAVSLGIVVDDTVHFLSKYLRARREQALGAEEAVRVHAALRRPRTDGGLPRVETSRCAAALSLLPSHQFRSQSVLPAP
jgi:hypothetical protein